ncbi:T9SS type A sorting domain-containing protein [Candidatus Nomurabacteria bacterium]|nr:T9SS type A sorting domain-containing protein [Candidatus Nomurabacteria bacterium]
MKKLSSLCIALLAIVFALRPASAETFTVPDDGTIQDGVDVTGSGDDIYISPGVYTETVYFDADTVSIHGLEADLTTIRNGTFVFNGGSTMETVLHDLGFDGPDGAAISLFNGSGVTVQNVLIRDKEGTAAIFVGSNSHLVLSTVWAWNNSNGALQGYATASSNFGQIEIYNARFEGNALNGIPTMIPQIENGLLTYRPYQSDDRNQNFGGGIYLPLGGGRVSIWRSLLANNDVNFLGGAISGGNDANIDSTIVDLDLCTIFGNDAGQNGSFFYGRNGKIRLNISNSLFVDNGINAFVGNVSFEGHNVAWPNNYDIPGLIVEDPLFCDPDGRNFQLGYSSFCLPENNQWGEQIGAFGAGECDGVGVEAIQQPINFGLTAHPNPFNPTTTINFNLQSANHVSLIIYDLEGRLVANLLDGMLGSGQHSVNFDASKLSSGSYFVYMTTNDQQQVMKLLLLK